MNQRIKKMVGKRSNFIMGILAVGLMAASSSAFAGGDKLECKAEGARDVSMDARFEQDGDRAKFDASFEAARGAGYAVGNVLQVRVGDEHVGDITLSVQLNGDLGGDLGFDNNVDRDAPDPDTVPFPANFPAVGAGTIVTIGTLGCSLQD
jgi:hypothetical protein